jgi:hypothetical protein
MKFPSLFIFTHPRPSHSHAFSHGLNTAVKKSLIPSPKILMDKSLLIHVTEAETSQMRDLRDEFFETFDIGETRPDDSREQDGVDVSTLRESFPAKLDPDESHHSSPQEDQTFQMFHL